MSSYDERGRWIDSPMAHQVTIAWHDGFGGTHTQDMPTEDAVSFIAELHRHHVDWVEIVGIGER